MTVEELLGGIKEHWNPQEEADWWRQHAKLTQIEACDPDATFEQMCQHDIVCNRYWDHCWHNRLEIKKI